MVSFTEYADSIGEKADAAFLQASKKVIKKARDAGTYIVIWEDDQIKKLSSDEMEERLRAQERDGGSKR
jgi:hypothetical protein